MANNNHNLHADNLSRGWVWTTIGEITRPVQKVDPTEKPDAEFIYLDISSIDNAVHKIREPKVYLGTHAPSRARQLVRVGDVLFSTVRTYLKNIAQVPEAYDGQIASTGFSVLRSEEGVSSKYLFYYCLTDGFLSNLGKLQRGTSYPAVRDSDVRAQPIPLAPTSEQNRIVAEIEKQFTRLDAGITALKRAQASLRRYKAAVLKAACEGKLVPQDPADEPASELLKRILAERRAKWEADLRAKGKDPKKANYIEPKEPDIEGLPELPEGWCWATMDQITDTIGGVTKGRNFRGQRTVWLPYLRVANVQRGQLDLGDVKQIEVLEQEIEKYRLHENDLVLTEGGDWDKLGRSAVWKYQIPNCIHQNHIFRARPYLPDLSTEWLMYYTNSEQGQAYFKDAAKQTTNLASINLTQLRACPVPLPPSAEQRRIVTEVDRRLSLAQKLEATLAATLARADRLRQSTLKRAFAGQLVPQNLRDEPASELLERIHAERERRKQEIESERAEATKTGKQGVRKVKKVARRLSLWETLTEAKKRLTPEELFRSAGFTVEHVDEFYEELRREVFEKKRIRQVRPNKSDVFLEAVKR